MESALRPVDPASRGFGRAREAWTAFWQDPGQSRCAAGAPEIWQVLSAHWAAFAKSLEPGTRVLDLGCGAGAVARLLLESRRDLHITGIDFARIPLTIHPQVDLLSDTAMECLPFTDGSFGAVVSQYGFEYSRREQAVRETSRVLASGARISLLVHHADSAIVTTNRARLDVLLAMLGYSMCSAFCDGDAPAFNAQMSALAVRFPHDTLAVELARCLPLRIGRAPRERVAIWNAIEEALAPERCLAQALNACCVGPEELDEWLAPLRELGELLPVTVVREPNGDPIAWRIEGSKRLAS
jgi:SAM-dependent methyltransferase